MNDQHLVEVDEGAPFLLNTIRIPKNIHYLTDRLPKPNYLPLRTRKIDKQRFLQTLAGVRDITYEKAEEQSMSPELGGKNLILPKIGSVHRKNGRMTRNNNNY